jgi:hypothetical protein
VPHDGEVPGADEDVGLAGPFHQGSSRNFIPVQITEHEDFHLLVVGQRWLEEHTVAPWASALGCWRFSRRSGAVE